jgi:hypothetical protein
MLLNRSSGFLPLAQPVHLAAAMASGPSIRLTDCKCPIELLAIAEIAAGFHVVQTHTAYGQWTAKGFSESTYDDLLDCTIVEYCDDQLGESLQ